VKRRCMSIVIIAALAACLVLAACGSSGSRYKEGTYTGTGSGAGGDVTVTLSIDGSGTISVPADGVTGEHETVGIGGREACEDGTFAEQINAAQSAQIDGVSGASLTSAGVREAVTDALAQAS